MHLFKLICYGLFITPIFASKTIDFYSDPLANAPSQHLSAQTSIVPIIERGDWIKVGLKPSGDIGWIKRKQLNGIKTQHTKTPTSSTTGSQYSFSYQVSQKNVDGHTETTATGYRNGKKLSNEEVMQLVHQQEANIKKYEKKFQNWFDQVALPQFDTWLEDFKH